MHESIELFLSFAQVTANWIMPYGTDSFYFHAIALAVVVLAAKIGSKKDDGYFHRFFSRAFKKTNVKRQHAALSPLKSFPKCAEQLPLSTLLCDTCDYNFLSGTVGHRHKLLPAPNAAASNG